MLLLLIKLAMSECYIYLIKIKVIYCLEVSKSWKELGKLS